MAPADGEAETGTVDWVARAEALRPALEAASPRIEQLRELPPDVVDLLHDAELFRLTLPRWLGGGEVAPATLSQVMMAIARADASTAWCLGQASGCAMSAAFLSREAAQEIFGPRDAAVAWGAGPQGRARPVDGGWRVTGKWMFASGSRHATWLGGHCLLCDADGAVRRGPDGATIERTVFFPRHVAEIDDVWQVVGLQGTGSDSYAVADLFVPARHMIARDDATTRTYRAPLYVYSTTAVFSTAFSGVALGVARGLVEALRKMAAGKTPRGAGRRLADDPLFQSELARMEGQLRAGRSYVLATADAIWREVCETGTLTLERRIEQRLAATHVIQMATQVSADAYRAAGVDAIFEAGPFQRRFRDAHAVSQQVQGRSSHYETVGRHLLGQPPDSHLFL